MGAGYTRVELDDATTSDDHAMLVTIAPYDCQTLCNKINFRMIHEATQLEEVLARAESPIELAVRFGLHDPAWWLPVVHAARERWAMSLTRLTIHVALAAHATYAQTLAQRPATTTAHCEVVVHANTRGTIGVRK